jgi:hypothetical protein
VKQHKYNLKRSIAALLITVAITPFIFFHFHAEDIFQYYRRDYHILDALTSSALILLCFAGIGLSSRLAHACARDPTRVSETVATARYCACIAAAILILCIAAYFM